MLQFLKNPFKKTPAKDVAFARAFYKLFGNAYKTADFNNEDIIEKTYNFNDTIYRTVTLITGAISQLDYKLIKTNEDGNKEEIYVHPFLDFLKQPNQHQNFWDYANIEILYYLITGNAFTYKIAPETGVNAGKVMQLHNFPSQLVNIVQSDNYFSPILRYEIQYLNEMAIEPNSIMHRKTPQLDYKSLYGMSPLEPAKRLITTNNSVRTASGKILQNGGMSGVLVAKDSQGLDQASLEDVAKNLRANFTGENEWGKFPMLSEALEWVQIGMKGADMQLVEIDKNTELKIAGLYNVPSVLMAYDENSTYNNITEARKQLYTNCAIPNFRNFLKSIEKEVLSTWGDSSLSLEVDTRNVPELQQDKKALAEALSKADWLSINQQLTAWGESDYSHPDADVPRYILEKTFSGKTLRDETL